VEIRGGTSSQGASFYTAKNPKYGALFTYYIAEDIKTLKAQRKKAEKALNKEKEDIPFPGWEALDAEMSEHKPKALLRISDASGNKVAEVSGDYTKGVHRVHWDLRQLMPAAIDIHADNDSGSGLRTNVAPGTYQVQLFKSHKGTLTQLSEKQSFEVVRLRQNVLENPTAASHASYREKLNALYVRAEKLRKKFSTTSKKIDALAKGLSFAQQQQQALHQTVYALQHEEKDIDKQLNGSPAKKEVGEKDTPTLSSRMSVATRGFYSNTYGPTQMHMESYDMAATLLIQLKNKVDALAQKTEASITKATAAGAPVILD
jgi:hypothetical protein